MTGPPSRRWFQLSLRSLFLLTLLVATFFTGYSLAMKSAEETVTAAREAQVSAETAMRQGEAARRAEELTRMHAEQVSRGLQADYEQMRSETIKAREEARMLRELVTKR